MSSSKTRIAPWADTMPLGAFSPVLVVGALVSSSALLRLLPVLSGHEPFGSKPALAAAVLSVCALLSLRAILDRLRRRRARGPM